MIEDVIHTRMLSRTVHGTPRSSYFFFLVCEYEQMNLDRLMEEENNQFTHAL